MKPPMMQRDDGSWVPAIPLPVYGVFILKCGKCGSPFWTMAGYRGHYALMHILEGK